MYSKESRIEEGKDRNANIFTRTTIEVNGILVKKAHEDSFVSVVSFLVTDSVN